ncbi:MAG: hypothetical protein AAF311_07050, partial [Pseudomonadota bacterium]
MRRRRASDRNRPIRKLATSLAVILFDSLMAALAVFVAVRLRYDHLDQDIIANVDYRAAAVAAVVAAIVWAVMRQDRLIWRFTSLSDFRRLFLGVVIV